MCVCVCVFHSVAPKILIHLFPLYKKLVYVIDIYHLYRLKRFEGFTAFNHHNGFKSEKDHEKNKVITIIWLDLL